MPGMTPPNYKPKPAPESQTVGNRALGFFMEKGLSRSQAAGIVGNLKQESNLNPAAAGGFLAQWLGERLKGLESFAAGKHETVAGNEEVQLEYIWRELTTSQKTTLAALRKTKTPEEAARVFSQGYERPSKPNLAARERYAAEAAKGTPIESGATPIQEGIETVENGVGGFFSELTGFLGKEVLTGILLLAGAVLVVYGLMVAVRPRESAFSIPRPGAIPVPV